ncbi:hypothetical protein IKF34_00385 [Candidatus Saccharibacteria bacterium]|nr:hypothetical protein [Candidatus Saccharibacteria bacterium]
MDDDYGPGVDLDGRKSRKGGSGMVLPGSEGYNKGASYILNGKPVDEYGNEIKKGKQKSSRRKEAADDLRGLEDGSAGDVTDDSGIPGVRNKEESGGIVSNVIGRGAHEKGEKKASIKGILKRKGPIGLIVGLILCVGVLAFSSQGFQLFSWVANINVLFGQSSAVLNLRSNFVLRRALNANPNGIDPNHTSLVKGSIFGSDKYKIGEKMTQKLKANNIDVVEIDGADGKPLRMLVWSDSTNGTKVPIVASDNDIGRIPKGYSNVDGLTLDVAKTTLDGFRVSLDTSTITITGKIAGWFDSLADAFLKRIGGSDARRKLNKLTNDSDSEEIDAVLYKNASDGADDSNTSRVVKEEEELDENGRVKTDEDGKPIVKIESTTDADFEVDNNNGDNSLRVGDTDTAKIGSKLKTTLKKAGVGGSVVCMVLRGIGAINAIVAGAQVANVINYTLKILEASDKVRAGDGNDSFNKIANSLNEPAESTAYDINGNPVTLVGAATESDGWNNAFSDRNIVAEDDPGALMVNREYATKNALINADFAGISDWGQLLGRVGTSVAAFSACNAIQLGLGAADLIGDVILFFTTAGIGNAVKEFFGGVFNAAKVTLAIGALSAAIALIAPMLGQWFAEDLSGIFRGKISGYAMDSGGHIIQGGNLQMSAGMNANEEQTIELYGMTKNIEKEWAAYDRATLSPFDASSKYTFLGSLVQSVIPVINSSRGSLVSSISSSASLLGSSMATLAGSSVSALNDVGSFKLSLSSDGHCANLTSMGLAGDVYCNKYSGAYIDDLDTMTSYEIYEKIQDSFEGFDEYGNPRIKANSDYAKYIIACNTNDAQPGTMSSVVEGYISRVSRSTSGDTVLGSTLLGVASGLIPFEGGLDVFQAIEEQNNIKWNSQAVCSDPSYRYYSDYSVDQRTLEGLGIIEKSAMAVFLDEYYEKNPLDNSYEGIIARYGGLTKEEVTDTLALIDYVEYVANYHPEERYAFGEPEVEKELKFDNEHTLAVDVMMPLGEIVYTDVRNRNFVV